VTQDMLDNAINLVERTPGLKEIFDNARNEYNAYNRDLMKFLASTGAISEPPTTTSRSIENKTATPC